MYPSGRSNSDAPTSFFAHTHLHIDSNSYSNTDSHQHADAYRHTYRNTDQHAHADRYDHLDTHANTNGIMHTGTSRG
jgi:hypothetical protein